MKKVTLNQLAQLKEEKEGLPLSPAGKGSPVQFRHAKKLNKGGETSNVSCPAVGGKRSEVVGEIVGGKRKCENYRNKMSRLTGGKKHKKRKEKKKTHSVDPIRSRVGGETAKKVTLYHPFGEHSGIQEY